MHLLLWKQLYFIVAERHGRFYSYVVLLNRILYSFIRDYTIIFVSVDEFSLVVGCVHFKFSSLFSIFVQENWSLKKVSIAT